MGVRAYSNMYSNIHAQLLLKLYAPMTTMSPVAYNIVASRLQIYRLRQLYILCLINTPAFCQPYSAALDMGWAHPWVGMGWVGSNFLDFSWVELGWVQKIRKMK